MSTFQIDSTVMECQLGCGRDGGNRNRGITAAAALTASKEGRKDRTSGARGGGGDTLRHACDDGRRDGRTRMLFKEMERAMIDDDSLNYSGSRKRTSERWTDGRERDQGRRERVDTRSWE